jgi:hypothetical protein
MTCIIIASNPPLQKRKRAGGKERGISIISEVLTYRYMNKHVQELRFCSRTAKSFAFIYINNLFSNRSISSLLKMQPQSSDYS